MYTMTGKLYEIYSF